MEKMGELLARLVSDLPSMGGWPEWAVECILHRGSCKAMFYDDGGRFSGHISFPDIKFMEEAKVEKVVYREMYEAALAASKPVWDGEGLPNIGCEIEVNSPRYGWKVAVVTAITDSWIVAKYSDGVEFAGCHRSLEGNKGWTDNDSIFRPIRSEADRKRAEGVIALSRIDPQAMPFEYRDKLSDGSLVGSFWYELYDAIAAGKIPHIRID